MTREKALEACRALEAIDGFHFFIDEVDKAIESAEELAPFSPKFMHAFNVLLETELLRLEKVLEDI